ncbi:hypothetical protein BH23VER1_BH23VER1_18780 [soil metagenome]
MRAPASVPCLRPWRVLVIAMIIAMIAVAVGGRLAAQEEGALTPEEAWEAGSAAYLAGDHSQAEAVFDRLVADYGQNEQLQPMMQEVTPMLALSKVKLGKLVEAGPLIDASLEIDGLPSEAREVLAYCQGILAVESGDFERAETLFTAFIGNAGYDIARRGEAVVIIAKARILAGDQSGAIAFLDERLPGLREKAPESASQAMVLKLHALIQDGDHDGALELLKAEYPRMGEVAQIVSFQTLALQLGSIFLEEHQFYAAIACLQRIWDKDRLVRHQRQRREALAAKIAILKERGVDAGQIRQREIVLRKIDRELAKFEENAEFDSALRLRLATAFSEMGRYREAALVMEEMLQRMAPGPILEQAAVSLMRCWMQVERWPRALAAAALYEDKFGGSALAKHLPEILFLRAECHKSAQDLDSAREAYDRVATEFPKSEVAPGAYFVGGIVRLMQDENAEAIARFQDFRTRFGKSPLAEDSLYWEGMAYSFAGNHQKCRNLLGVYLDDHPKGKYLPDAVFRRAFASHSLAYYETGIDEFRAFIAAHPDSSYADEAKLLLGDALMAVGEIDGGIAAYKSIDPGARRFYEDGWFKIGKPLWLREEYAAMRHHFQQFIDDFPESNRIAEAVYQIGRTHQQGGETEKAKDIYWKTIRELGGRPDYYAIEDILAALPRLYRGTEGGPVELIRDLDRLRQDVEEAGGGVLRARLLWAKSHALGSASPGLAAATMLEAGGAVDPKLHNPRITVDCAEARLANGHTRVARELYLATRKWHPRTPEKDRVFAGLGRIAVAEGEPYLAADYFEKCLATSFRLGLRAEVILEIADLHLELKVPHKAREVLEELLGDSAIAAGYKAEALLRYAGILEQEKDLKKALAYYERVYVAYGKYQPLVAKAYLQRARLLEELDMKSEALEVYRELAGREDLAGFEQVAEAEGRIGSLEGGAL